MHFVDAKGILTASGGHCGMNVYRGCTHGCIYCDSRSLCYHFTHPFEDIEVKQNAPELLEKALRSKRRKCMIGTGSMSDPYMHCEEQLGLTRKCLEVILKYGFGAAVQTKSDRILRDIDLLSAIHRQAKCVIQMTLTTWDDALCGLLEPNVCRTKRRVEVLEAMRDQGIPTVVWLTPILPFINDTEENVRPILEAGGGQGVLLRRPGPALSRPQAAVHRAVRKRLRAAEPKRRPADGAVLRLLPGPRHPFRSAGMFCVSERSSETY